MAKGIMLKRRGQMDCEDCHFGKQRRKTYQKALKRHLTRFNDIVFADLLIPGICNGSIFFAVLVVMDGFTRYVTIHPLKSKTEGEVNNRMQNYVAWAQRQKHFHTCNAVLHIDVNRVDPTTSVRQILTDKGAEFCDGTIEAWYITQGIHMQKLVPYPPN